MQRTKEKALNATAGKQNRDEGNRINTYEREETMNPIVSHSTDKDEVTAKVTAWLKNEYEPLRERETTPITGTDDPRAQALIQDPYHVGSHSGLGYTLSFLEELVQEDPQAVAELYFLRYVEKPEPPLPMPAWAESKEILWGQYPEIGILYRSQTRTVGSWSLYFEQLISIQVLDDHTREPLDEVVIHEGPTEFEITDGSHALSMPGDVSAVEMLAAAMDDVARHFSKHSGRDLTRHTAPGAPAFEESFL